MNSEGKGPSKSTVVAKWTRTWTSGTVRFVVRNIDGHPEKNYITLEKDLVGKPLVIGYQRFRLNLRDWKSLKSFVEGELAAQHKWILEDSVPPGNPKTDQLNELLKDNPELIEKILDAPNVRMLSAASFEALNRLVMRVYKVQSQSVELVLKNLSKASPEEFEQFAALLSDLRLGQVATLANLVKQKLEIIELFERLSHAMPTREKEIHKLIEDNPWIAHNSYEVLASDKPLSAYLDKNVPNDPEMKLRPDLIVKRKPNCEEIVLIELKRPSVKLRPSHIGQVLEYKGLIQKFKPSTRSIDCYLFGYEKHDTFTHGSKDVTIRTFSELTSTLRDDYRAYLKVLEDNEEQDLPDWLRD
jgi:hypothetical protein